MESEDPEITARFILEARATAQFSHENIVVIHEVGEHGGHPFMVLEYLQGSPLTYLLEPGVRLAPKRVIELIVPVVRALVAAHQHSIVHRDLKPDNIFVTETGTVKVLDFGIAKLTQDQAEASAPQPPRPDPSRANLADAPSFDTASSSDLTRAGALVGTIPYMSPEQWAGVGVDHQSDIWAVGILLYTMLTGKHPLAPLRGRALMVTGVLDQPMPSVRGDNPELDPELADIVDRCLQKPKAARMPSASELLGALEPLLPSRRARAIRANESPYPGLSAFQEKDAERFFGRNQQIATAVTRLRDQPLLGVVGPSGVGKSSFVRAGLLPALKQSGEHWTALVVRPGREPVAALAHAIAPLVGRSSITIADDLSDHEATRDRLHSEPGWLGAVLRSRARRKRQKILLFVDQFEELYTLVADPAERLAFTACLASVADDATTPLRVALSIRSDFLDRASEDSHFMAQLSQSLFFLAPPSRAGLREAIIEPAELAGYRFEAPSTVEHMLDYLQHTPGALPLLQFAASKLWEMRDPHQKLLTQASYDHLGGIAGALASHADATVAELPTKLQGLVRALFLRLVTVERTRAVVPIEELRGMAASPDDMQRLIDRLVQARLLVVQRSGADVGGRAATTTGGFNISDLNDDAAVEIVHESLIQRWPLLTRWLDENQEDAAFLEQLRAAARQWHAKGYSDGLLWRGEAMQEAKRWHRRYRGALPQLEQRYLHAVFALAGRTARRRRYLGVAAIVFLSLLVAATTAGMIIIGQARQEAVAQADAAERAAAEVSEKLAIVEAEKRARERAEGAARVAASDADRAREEVALTAEQLAVRNQELEDALGRANQAKQRARRAREEAEQNETVALAAELQAQQAKADLERALKRERKRIRELQRRSGMIIEDLNQEDFTVFSDSRAGGK
ncbi:MAG: serine/threonine-protein kinase [Haliangiales bacterium]